jgi:20S proteasome subunit alpha 5
MFLTRSEYDRGVNTFSPEGRLFQVEYAIEAIKLGSTAIGIQTSEGVVLAVEKRISSTLLVPSSIKKLAKLDGHMGCAMSGLVADARTLIDHARVETQNHWFTFNEKMKTESCVQSISDIALRFGEGNMARPFGVALLLGGVDANGPVLFHTDPSGTYSQYQAKAIGAGSEGAQQQLQEQYNKSLKLHEAQKLAFDVLKQVMEEKISPTNVEMAVITPKAAGEGNLIDGYGTFRILSKEENETLIKTLNADPFDVAMDEHKTD